jgi:cytochrome c oxidase subunit 2
VNVTGQQFTWSFEYPGEGKVKSNQLVLPKDRPVEFKIRANDVIHSFWVPAFRLKQDAVPGMTTSTRLTPNREGTYQVVCAELCGLGHATMRQDVRVVPPREFSAWIAKRRGGGTPPGAAAAQDTSQMGREAFEAGGCGNCHTLAAAGGKARIGPNLDELARVAGERERGTSAAAYVKESILDPNAFVVKGFPRDTMPKDFKDQFSPEEIDALVSYLLEVGKKKGK